MFGLKDLSLSPTICVFHSYCHALHNLPCCYAPLNTLKRSVLYIVYFSMEHTLEQMVDRKVLRWPISDRKKNLSYILVGDSGSSGVVINMNGVL